MRHSPTPAPAAPIPPRRPAHSWLVALLALRSLAAQDEPPKPLAPAGLATTHELSADERAAARGQRTGITTDAIATAAVVHHRDPLAGRVLFDATNDGTLWVATSAYKASLSRQGFTYYPFFGSRAPRLYPVQFALRSLRIGGQVADFATAVAPERAGARVTYRRGPVQEVYDLRPGEVEQTFVVDSALAGDLDLELQVVSDLREDASRAGLQFVNELGEVSYGDAFVVADDGKRAVPSSSDGGVIRIHVPAALRTGARTVIDPIIQSYAFSAGTTAERGSPDVAYSSGWCMLVWELRFAATDYDVYSEICYESGAPYPGTLEAIDNTAIHHQGPRVAAMRHAWSDRALVVMERQETSTPVIWGRIRSYNTSVPIDPGFQVSASNVRGACRAPDVGGDPNWESGGQWLVVWSREYSPTDFDVLGCVVNERPQMGPTIAIENSSGTVFTAPQVSQSNGRRQTDTTQWLVAYSHLAGPGNWDVYASVIDGTGLVTRGRTLIDGSAASDLHMSVSSPAHGFSGGRPRFLVTWERQSPAAAMAALLDDVAAPVIAPTNLTQTLGVPPFWVRTDSDGYRFALVAGSPTQISVGTLVADGGRLLLNDPLHPLPGSPSYPRVVAKRSGGATAATEYGVVYLNAASTPNQVWLTSYHGHAPLPDAVRRPTGCGNLYIGTDDNANIGDRLVLNIGGIATDLAGLLVGMPAPSTPLCGGCSLGVDPQGPLLPFVGNSLFGIPIPFNPRLVGVRLSAQAFAVGSGNCLGRLRVSDTLDFAIR